LDGVLTHIEMLFMRNSDVERKIHHFAIEA
jgi:hypothetical protein